MIRASSSCPELQRNALLLHSVIEPFKSGNISAGDIHMCFFFIMGIVPREKAIGTETQFCQYCGTETTHTLYERRLWFTAFFLPLFPVSRKEIVARCASCGFEHSIGAGTEAHHGRRIFEEPQRPTWGRRDRAIKVCPNCGTEVVEGANFCQHCGHRF